MGQYLNINATGQEINQDNLFTKQGATFTEVGTSLDVVQNTLAQLNITRQVAIAGQLDPTNIITLNATFTGTRRSDDMDIIFALVDTNDVGVSVASIDVINSDYQPVNQTGSNFPGDLGDVSVQSFEGQSSLHAQGEQGVIDLTMVFDGQGNVTQVLQFNGVEVMNVTEVNPIDLTTDLRFGIGADSVGENFQLDSFVLTLDDGNPAVPEPSTYILLVLGLACILRQKRITKTPK